MKLAGKLILLFIGIVIAVTALSSHFTSQQFFAHIQQQHRKIALSLDQQQHDQDFQRAMKSGDHVYFQKMVRTMSGEVAQVRWVWLARKDRGSADSDLGHRPFAYDQTETIIRHGGVMSLTHKTSDGHKSLLTYCPIASDGRTGAIEIASPLDQVDTQTRNMWLAALFSIGAMGLLGIGLVMTAGVRWIARPLEKLTEKMKRVGNGDFTSDLDIKSRDELGQLATAVNQMCNRLKTQQETIASETQQRIQANEQLRHADRLKTVGQLAAGLAHEVGTPLNVISGRATLLLADAGIPAEKVRDNALAIKTESERISLIIAKLLDFARRSPSNKNVGDLREVVTRAVELIRPLASERDVELHLSLPDHSANASFDFNQMQQVLMNLIDNAVDASVKGQSVDIRLRLRDQTTDDQNEKTSGRANDQRYDFAEKSDTKNVITEMNSEPSNDSFWVIEVNDQGCGIKPENAEEIFEPFFTTKPVGSGTGLGLSIAYGILEEHNGSITFNSSPETGTRFLVKLPAKK